MTSNRRAWVLRVMAGLVGLVMGVGGASALHNKGLYPTSPSHGGPDRDALNVDTFEVLVLLPFGLHVDTLPGGDLPRKAGRLREIALESLHGIEAAARELAAAGVPMRLNVADEIPDSSGKIQVSNLDFARASLVLGPLLRENVGVLAQRIDRFGREQVLLTEQPEPYVQRGPAVRQALSSELFAAEMLGHLVAAAHDTDNVMLVVTGASEAALERRFEETYNTDQRLKWRTPADSVRYALLDTVKASARSAGNLSQHVTPYERNVVVSVAGRSARSMWAALQTELQMNDSSDFVLFGHPELADMPFVEGELMEKWRMTLPQTSQIAWHDSTLWISLQEFRMQTGTEPQKYATLAHDALVDAASRRYAWIQNRVFTWGQPFVWAQTEANGSWVNQAWTLTRFEDLHWAKLDTLGPVPPFVPRLFYDEEENVIPVPEAYRFLFPEEYPNN